MNESESQFDKEESEWPYITDGRLNQNIDHEKIIKKGEPWTDPDFPPKDSSLFVNGESHFKAKKYNKKKVWNEYVWIRAGDHFGGKEYLFDTIEPEDVKQGNADNCHLLATLSGLAERDMDADTETKAPGKTVRDIFIT